MKQFEPLRSKSEHTRVNRAFLDLFKERAAQVAVTRVWGGPLETFYLPDLDLWLAPGASNNRYWNAFGPGDPFRPRYISPSLEINLAYSPGSSKPEGRFLRDRDGTIWIGHSGKLGGSRAGLTRGAFQQFFGGAQEVTVAKRNEKLLLLGRLDEPAALVEEVARLAHFAQDFREGLAAGTTWEQRNRFRGAGFGNAEQNARVEAAAINAVRAHYEGEGWAVTSVERDRIGYDLCCARGRAELHVEVKGVAGELVEFIMTAGEFSNWQRDQKFVVAVVLRALTMPRVIVHGAADIHRFTATPIAYRIASA